MKRAFNLFSGAALIALAAGFCGCDGGMIFPLIELDSETGALPGGHDTGTVPEPRDSETSPEGRDSDTFPEHVDSDSDPFQHDSDTGEAPCRTTFCYDTPGNCEVAGGTPVSGKCEIPGFVCCAMRPSCSSIEGGTCISLHTNECVSGNIRFELFCEDPSTACCEIPRSSSDHGILDCPTRAEDFYCMDGIDNCYSAPGTPAGSTCPGDDVCCYTRQAK